LLPVQGRLFLLQPARRRRARDQCGVDLRGAVPRGRGHKGPSRLLSRPRRDYRNAVMSSRQGGTEPIEGGCAGEHKRPDFLHLNPAGKVPVLVDGDLVIPESAAIVLYVADKYRDKGLLLADLKERAHAYRWVMLAVTELEQSLWRIAKHTALYSEDKRLPADIAPAKEEFIAPR